MNILISLAILAIIFIIYLWHIKKTEKNFSDTFKSLSFDVMEKNNKAFLDLASNYFEKHKQSAEEELKNRQTSIESLLNPIKESLKDLDNHNKEIEKQRLSSYSSLNQQINSLIQTEHLLKNETQKLSRALKSPNIRGTWGQLHLKRVVELSGMLKNCDFFEQQNISSDDKIYKPDMIIKLPGKRNIIVDAKTPIDAYMEALEANDADKKKEKLTFHAKHIRQHIKDLKSKQYWKHISPSPEYVILFLPAEAFFSSALEIDPNLLEVGAKENIIIATPTTLIAILRAIAYCWKQENITKNAKEIINLAKELYDRLLVLNNHWEKLGKNLSMSVEAYNQVISSINSRVLVSVKKLKNLGIEEEKELNILTEISKEIRGN